MRTQALSRERIWLIDLIRGLDHGAIEQLVIKKGEPVMSRPPIIIREVKFGCPRKPTRSWGMNSEVDKRFVELFDEFEKRPNCIVDWLEIRDGLPSRMRVEEKDISLP